MVTIGRVLLTWLALAAVAYGNAANCYWFLEADAETIAPGTIKVVYASGHTVNFGPGDYLPVGCNVVEYRIVPETFSSAKGLFAHSPSCATAVHPSSVLIWQTGQPANSVAIVSGSLSCGGCNTNCTSVPPNKPPPGQHPNGNGDDDGDGVRNDCDPDEVACVDADSDGCCDVCEDGSFGGCGGGDDNDDDDDGIRNECDVDEQPCADYDSDGCCDYCGDECGPPCDAETECCEGEPGYPECDDCDEETECCEGEPGYPACDDCTPEHPEYPDCMPCEDNPEHPDYPDCEEPCSGPDCDPCPKLDAIIALLGEISAKMPENQSPSGTNPTYQNPIAPPQPMLPGMPDSGWLPEFSSAAPDAFQVSIPIPGRSPLLLSVAANPTTWGLGPGLLAVVQSFQALVYGGSWLFMAFSFVRGVLKLVGSL